jgi:hypothetical protein
VSRAEAALRTLRDVEGASILLEGDDIREVHIVTHSTRPAKLIVRDVQAILLTKFDRSLDYRVVSVAHTRPESARAGNSKTAENATPAASGPTAESAPPRPRPAPAPAPASSSRVASSLAESDSRSATGERIRFAGVNLFVSGPRTQAQVELKWKGVPRMGSASGWSTRAGAYRLIAAATLAAVQEFIADEVALGVHEVEFVRLGKRRAVVVSLSLLAHRSEKTLVGGCTVEHDVQQAVVLATLSALNRLVGGLPTKEPTEYLLRPTST